MQSRKSSLISFLSCLLYPPKCCSCGELLQKDILDITPRALCERCRIKWEYAGLAVCPKCGEELYRCHCMPAILKRAGAAAALKLVFYEKDRDSVGRRLILFMKRKNGKCAPDFLAGELARPVRRYFEETATAEKSVFVTYVPRGTKKRLELGFDQAENLAVALAKQLGTSCGRLIGRHRHTETEQKSLGQDARLLNANGTFCLAKADFEALDRNYRCILLVDDVMTTGASLAACTRLLREKFHGRIVCATPAWTAKQR